MKKIILLALSLIILTSCSNETSEETEVRQKYERTFFETFDTIVTYVAYEESEEKFNEDADFVEEEFRRLHKLYDNYNTYQDLNNIKTVNDNAGQGPVQVDEDLISLLVFSKEGYKNISPKVNVAMGSVLDLWHNYREEGIENPEEAEVLPLLELDTASQHMDIEDVIIDEEAGTVEIIDPELSINLGATAKGYATELVCDSLEERGVDSAILSAGGNVKTLGKPADGRDNWGIGIQNPENAMGNSKDQLRETLFVQGTSVVTSGDYQRYYIVDGKKYHHIIDPDTLQPANYYSSVSVMVEDSGLADFLSTAAFLLPFEESKALIEDHGAEGLWIMPDNSIKFTDGMKDFMKSQGADS